MPAGARPSGRSAKAVPPRRPNPLTSRESRPQIKAPTVFKKKASDLAAAKALLRKRGCPNRNCTEPNIEDGTCTGCGWVVNDSNIVSEVQFGESSSGAAVVQGSFLSADQGTARNMGPGFRRSGGSEEGRENTVREGKRSMQQMANHLHIQETIVLQAVQILKMAVSHNFIQGRRMEMVCAVCLYSACRMTKPCRIMLIDFADKIGVNVFKLGRTFKALHQTVSFNGGMFPVLPEDLIWRFAAKLEFGNSCDKVAEDAVRMVQRMSVDWMVMGRRPSGVCGACLILAARMNNFRRTITEVVYVVKVTTHTIQKRLDEFKLTPSSALTVDEFLNNEFLESAHDPPSFYEKTEEFQKSVKKRKRKRGGHDGIHNEDGQDGGNEGGDDGNDEVDEGPNKRQKSAAPPIELRRDADGFAIPPTPAETQAHSQVTAQASQSQASEASGSVNPNIDPNLEQDELVRQLLESEFSGASINQLVEEFGDNMDNTDSLGNPTAGPDGTGDAEEAEEEETDTISPNTSPKKKSGRPKDLEVQVDPEWEKDEDLLMVQMSEMVSDPNTIEHAVQYARARKRVAEHMAVAMINQKVVSMDAHIGEDEFSGDPEVENCALSPEDVARKEKVWVNENKSWLRAEQIKAYKRKVAENGPPKAKRNRKKKPRIGEGQTSPAGSAGEAAVSAMKERSFSKKVNYEKIKEMLGDEHMGSSGLGSAATSKVTSRAGSELGSVASEIGDDDSVMDPDDYVPAEKPQAPKPAIVVEEVEEEVEEDEQDWRKGEGSEGYPSDNEEYPDMGYGDDGPNLDMEYGAFDGPEEMYDYE